MAMATTEFAERWKGTGNVSQSVRHIVSKQLESKLGRSVISKSKASDYLLPDKTEEGPE